MANILTLYYSLSGETIAPGMTIVNLEKGHTAAAAEFIQQAVGGDLFEIETVKTYNPDHMTMIYEAKEELDQGIRPAIRHLPDLANYDTVFLGFPNWWNRLPMPVVSVLERLDWHGKTIIPYVTSGGSGFGQSLDELRRICTGATIKDGAAFIGNDVETSAQAISNWATHALND